MVILISSITTLTLITMRVKMKGTTMLILMPVALLCCLPPGRIESVAIEKPVATSSSGLGAVLEGQLVLPLLLVHKGRVDNNDDGDDDDAGK